MLNFECWDGGVVGQFGGILGILSWDGGVVGQQRPPDPDSDSGSDSGDSDEYFADFDFANYGMFTASSWVDTEMNASIITPPPPR